jgi:hypothetical protein
MFSLKKKTVKKAKEANGSAKAKERKLELSKGLCPGPRAQELELSKWMLLIKLALSVGNSCLSCLCKATSKGCKATSKGKDTTKKNFFFMMGCWPHKRSAQLTNQPPA